MEQRPQHKKWKFYGARHWKLLSGKAHGLVWIYENTFESISTSHHWTIWYTIKGKKLACISLNQTLHIWIATSWSAGKWATPKIPCYSRILRTRPHARTLEARYKTYSVHIGGGWFWGQICGAIIYRAPNQQYQEALWMIRRLGRETILWHHIWL